MKDSCRLRKKKRRGGMSLWSSNSGLPVWLHNIPGIQLRTASPLYVSEMKTFTTLIVDMMKRETLFASQGGPIILSQV
ncbi:beta-galactosidase 15-like isoform X2 [Castanea sativa]|uniref:beta-galactosidase 15-like isoform X2 n=1 Tax=Castanea sativa TaxID=21020 RepID=UPI003F651182